MSDRQIYQVVCISNTDDIIKGFTYKLTVGKRYTVLDVRDVYNPDEKKITLSYTIFNDIGDMNHYYSDRFLEVKEYRNKIIDNILSDE